MYTIVFYEGDTLKGTIESSTKPVITDNGKTIEYDQTGVLRQVSTPFYVVEGSFDGVVDPSKGINTEESEIERLRKQLAATEDTLYQFMMM